MYWLVIAVFQVAVWWLVDTCRDEAARRLQDGDVADQQVRDIIIREMNAIKSNLDGLLKRDLLASIEFFKEGVEFLYDAIEQTRPRNEYGADTEQAACAEVMSLVERTRRNLELTESGTRQLRNAKERFRSARERATIAFSMTVLSITDRILAMQYRLMATVLETIDSPEDAILPFKLCIEELNGLPVVQQCLKEQFKTRKAVRGLFKKRKRRKVITGVYLANLVAYRVRQITSVKEPLPQWPMIDTGKEKVDLLRDQRVTEILFKQGMENCNVSWILGHDGEEEHRLNDPRDMATNSSKQHIVADNDLTIKVFDNSGKFVQRFRLPPLIDDSGEEPSIDSEQVYLATDINDNIYVLVREESREDSHWIFSFNKTAEQHHRFRVRTMGFDFSVYKPSVSDNGKVVVLKGNRRRGYYIVDVYETDGQFYCSFGEQIFRNPCEITTVSNGRVMVMEEWDPTYVHIFSERGDHLNKFDLQSSLRSPKIAFHRESQQVVVVGSQEHNSVFYIGTHSKDGEFVRSTLFHMRESFTLYGIAVTTEGRIAVVTEFTGSPRKVTII